MGLTEALFTYIPNLISSGGYGALFVLTLLDSTVLPVPNETIMPFAGFLIGSGRFTFLGVLITSTLGGIVGSLTSYAIGYYGAEPIVKKWGKYVRVSMTDIMKTHAFFEKYGEKIILASRFIPVVRQFVSVPAGAAKMNVKKFILYTALGSLLWNSVITVLGYYLGTHWSKVKNYTSLFDKIIIVVVILFISHFMYTRRKKKVSTP